MVEEALSGPTPRVDHQPRPHEKAQASGERPAAAIKSASIQGAKKAAGNADKKQKLIFHLLIGFLMAVIALAGYAFLGPQAHASAADSAANHFIDVTHNAPSKTAGTQVTYDQSQMSDIAAMQAQMDAINRQINALKVENMANRPMGMSSHAAGATIYNSTTGYSSDPASARIDHMRAMLNEMMRKMNTMNTQAGGMTTPMSGSGHNGHH